MLFQFHVESVFSTIGSHPPHGRLFRWRMPFQSDTQLSGLRKRDRLSTDLGCAIEYIKAFEFFPSLSAESKVIVSSFCILELPYSESFIIEERARPNQLHRCTFVFLQGYASTRCPLFLLRHRFVNSRFQGNIGRVKDYLLFSVVQLKSCIESLWVSRKPQLSKPSSYVILVCCYCEIFANYFPAIEGIDSADLPVLQAENEEYGKMLFALLTTNRGTTVCLSQFFLSRQVRPKNVRLRKTTVFSSRRPWFSSR